MSTRCQIGFYENDEQNVKEPSVLIYRHSDGYPESDNGVVAQLLPFLRLFDKRRGLSDVQYASAWVMWHLIQTTVDRHLKFEREMVERFPDGPFRKLYEGDDGVSCLGYGIDSENFAGGRWHGDIEYYYAVYPSALKVYEVQDAPEHMYLIETHNIK